MLFEGQAGRFTQKQVGQVVGRFTGLGSLAVTQVEGEGDECTRAGLRFHMQGSAATGIASGTGLPTTTAAWLLYNPQGSLITAFLDQLSMLLVSGTAGAGGALFIAEVPLASLPTTRPASSAASINVVNANPSSIRSSRLIIATSQTLAANPGWQLLANMVRADTVVGQTSMEARDLRGKYSIAPDTAIALQVVSPTGTSPLWAPAITWREYATDLE